MVGYRMVGYMKVDCMKVQVMAIVPHSYPWMPISRLSYLLRKMGLGLMGRPSKSQQAQEAMTEEWTVTTSLGSQGNWEEAEAGEQHRRSLVEVEEAVRRVH